MEEQYIIEDNNSSSADSNNELYDDEELADLLRRYHAKFSRNVTTQSTLIDSGVADGSQLESSWDRTCTAHGFDNKSTDDVSSVISQTLSTGADIELPQLINEKGTASQATADINADKIDSICGCSIIVRHLKMRSQKRRTACKTLSGIAFGNTKSIRDCSVVIRRLMIKCPVRCITYKITSDSLHCAHSTSTNLFAGSVVTYQTSATSVHHYKCSLCMKKFCNCKSLKLHIKRRKNGQGRYHQKSILTKSSPTKHVKNLHGEKKYKCDKCDFCSNVNFYVKKHISAVHLGEKPNKCPQCDSCFAWKSHLTRHVAAIHNHEKPYECSLCHKKFSQRVTRDVHFRTVHCTEKPYVCDLCNYTSKQKVSLVRHRRIAHG